MTSIQYLENGDLQTMPFDETNKVVADAHRQVLVQFMSEKKPGLRVIMPDGKVWFPPKNGGEKTHVVKVVYGFRNEAFRKLREGKVSMYPYESGRYLTGGTEVLVDAKGILQAATVIECGKAEKATLDTEIGKGHHVKPVLRILTEL